MTHSVPEMRLPLWRGPIPADQLETVGQRAMAVYDRHRSKFEQRYAAGTYVVLDGADDSGETHTIGADVIAVQEEHYRRFPDAFATSCIFTVGTD